MRTMPTQNSTVDRFTLFGVTILIKYENGCSADLTRLLPSCWNAPELTDNADPVYIVIRSYTVNHEIPEDAFMTGGTSLAVCRNGIRINGDGASGYGVCDYPKGSREDSQFLELIDMLALFLVAQAGRIPLHASAAVHGKTAVVFAGRSGAGKSSMAFAASRAGMAVLSDDTVYVQSEPLKVWGMPAAIHLLASGGVDCGNFPLRYRGGKLKHALPVGRGVHQAEQAVLCVLTRGQEVAFDPMEINEAVDMLTRDPEPGYGLYGSRSADAIRAIATRGCWKLTLSDEPSAAIATLLNEWPRISGDAEA